MPHERHIPGSAADWLARAKGDLAIARTPLPEGAFYEDLCFHSQQAAEKALKAVYQHKGGRRGRLCFYVLRCELDMIGGENATEARIDAAGARHHVIIRGIEGRKIYRCDADRENFTDRLSRLLPET